MCSVCVIDIPSYISCKTFAFKIVSVPHFLHPGLSALPKPGRGFCIHRTRQVSTMFTFFSAYFFTRQRLGPEECSRVNTLLYAGLAKG